MIERLATELMTMSESQAERALYAVMTTIVGLGYLVIALSMKLSPSSIADYREALIVIVFVGQIVLLFIFGFISSLALSYKFQN